METGMLFRDEVYAIQGAVFEVYREKGCGFSEAVYQECLEMELQAQGIPFLAQPELKIEYKGRTLRQTYKPDLVCHRSIIVELKALSKTSPEHTAQVLNYLKAADLQLGLLVNFGHHPKATVQRIIL
jgi:GxxExxY protein